MLLDAIITVLRETLEAGVVVSVLVSMGRWRGIRGHWVPGGLLLGLSGGVIYALDMRSLSQAFDYAGQEVVNASLQYSIAASLLALLALHARLKPLLLTLLLVWVVALVVVREGAEIMIFFTALLSHEGMALKILSSGFVGLAIGASVGIVCFYCLNLLALNARMIAQIVLLAMIAAGMVAQGTQLLIQVDWVSAGPPLWNTNPWLNENSMTGQVAYAVFGYEATPSGIEVALYSASLTLALMVGLGTYLWVTRKTKGVW